MMGLAQVIGYPNTKVLDDNTNASGTLDFRPYMSGYVLIKLSSLAAANATVACYNSADVAIATFVLEPGDTFGAPAGYSRITFLKTATDRLTLWGFY